MPAPIDVMFHQRILAASGFSPGPLDGIWGKKTEDAERAFQNASVAIRETMGEFDPRTEGNIMTLTLPAQRKAREFMKIAGNECKILSGTRTYAEQNALFNQRPVVTRARGGQSNHNFGIAWDVGIFQGGHYLTGATRLEEQAYDALAKRIKASMDGLEWGGDWKSIIDKPHYQLATGKTLTQVRAAFESGTQFV